jgi:hypothetical protein
MTDVMELFNIEAEILRQRRKNLLAGQPEIVILGDGRGTNPDVNLYEDSEQRLWCRWPGGPDENGTDSLGLPFTVMAGYTNYICEMNQQVRIRWDRTLKDYIIDGPDPVHMRATGRSMVFLNPHNPRNNFIRPDQWMGALSGPVGGMFVNMQQWVCVLDDGTVIQYEGSSADPSAISQHQDLSAYAPDTLDQHRYACLVFNVNQYKANAEPLQIVVSTPKSITLDLTPEDIAEALATRADYSCKSIWAYRVAYGQTELRRNKFDRDLRGMPGGPLTIPVGFIDGDMIQDDAITLAHLTNDVIHAATTDPTVDDDSAHGYGVGSRWINTVDDTVFECVDATTGDAVWIDLTDTASISLTSPDGTIDITGSYQIDVADGAIDLSKLDDGTPNTLLGFDGSGTPVERALDNDGTLSANSSDVIPTQQAVKSYVDSVAQGLSAKRSVLAATATALAANTYSNGSSGIGATITASANGALTIDGQSVAVNDRVLIKDESSASHNGIYVVTAAGSGAAPFVLTRATDFDLASEIPGAYVFVENGTVNNAVSFIVADPGPFTIGTTAIDWTTFSRVEDLQVTAPIVKTGNNLSLDSTVVITTTPQTLTNKILTQLVLLIGGWKATIVHAFTADHTVTIPGDANVTLVGETTTQNVDNKTINNSSIGVTTQAAGYFSALRLYVSTKAAIFTHAFTADRTVTLPGNADVTLVGVDTAQTLANKVLSQLHLLLGGFKGIFTHSNTADRTYTFPNYSATISPATTKGDISAFNGTDNTRLPVGTVNGHALIVDSSTSTGLAYGSPAIDHLATWGESMAGSVGKAAFKSTTDGKWYKADNNAVTPLMGLERGLISDLGASSGTINTQGYVRSLGPIALSGLAANSEYFLTSTAGGIDVSEPTPTLDGGTVIIARFGYAISSTLFFVDCRQPVTYRRYETWAAGEIVDITHHVDAPSLLRRTAARVVLYDTGLSFDYPTSNRDSAVQLKGIAGAGATITADTSAATSYRVGDAGGNERREAQSLLMTAGQLTQITFNMAGSSGTPSPAGMVVEFWSNTGGTPGSGGIPSTVLYSTTVSSPLVGVNTINITDGPLIDAGHYWTVFSCLPQATNVGYNIRGGTTSGYANGVSLFDQTAALPFPGSWAGANAGDLTVTATTSAVVTNDNLAQGITPPTTTVPSSFKLSLRRFGSATGLASVEVCADSSGNPGTVLATTSTVDVSTLTTSFALVDFPILVGSRPSLSSGVQYHLKLKTTGSQSNTAWVEWGIDTTSPSYSGGVMKVFASSAWAAASPAADGCFEVYAQTTEYEQDLGKGDWDDGTGGKFAIQYGDSLRANQNTITRFKSLMVTTVLAKLDTILT